MRCKYVFVNKDWTKAASDENSTVKLCYLRKIALLVCVEWNSLNCCYNCSYKIISKECC